MSGTESLPLRGPDGLSTPAAAEEMAGLGTWVLDLPSGDILVRRGFRRLLGASQDGPEPGPDDYHAAVHPEDRAELAAYWSGLIVHGREYCTEHRLLPATGGMKYVRAIACLERDEQGLPVRAFGVTEDITALRLATLAVEHERDRSRAVLGSLQEGYLLVKDGYVVELNGAASILTGYSERQLLGMAVPGPLWPQDRDEALDELRERLAAGRPAEQDVVVRRADGSQFEAHVTVTPLAGPDSWSSFWVVVLRDITEQRAYERLLLLQSQTDALTGLLNSRSFRERLHRAVEAATDDWPLSLAILDVDHFKSVNDRFGHAVGDEVLCAVARRLHAATGNGILARVGGEEFALLLPGTTAQEARAIVHAGLQALRERPMPDVGIVTASAGVAQLLGTMTDDALYRLADARLYEAKSNGRDQLV